jgi:3-dehydroquinate dehydratase/shikimate dehydrogenase
MLQEFLCSHAFLGIHGLSVTIPHKEEACLFATVRSPEVEATGSANTLLLGEDGSLSASNTDYDAVLDSILSGLKNHPGGWTLKGKRALVLGAGGVARSVVCGLIAHGAEVALAGRTQSRAEAIAALAPCTVVPWENRHAHAVDIVVNCTPVGMHPDIDKSPLDVEFIVPGMVVMDTIYNPENTLLIRQAREKGAVATTGLDMFIGQAAAQFKLFTGEPAPADLMRQVARNALAIRPARPGVTGQPAR